MATNSRFSARVMLVALLGFAAGGTATGLARARSSASSPYDLLQQLGQVLALIENDYVEPVDRTRLLQGAVKGMVAELDPHSSYMTPEEYAVFRSDTEGSFAGIGVEVDFRDEGVVVLAPIDGSPAARAGVKSGDRIVAVEGAPVRGKSGEELVRLMRGAPGTFVTITIRRQGSDEPLYFKLEREVIHVSSVTGKLLRGGIAYLRIKQFQTGTHDELMRTVGQLRAHARGELAGVLLDLRNNPGGLVDEASGVADELLSGGIIYTTRHRGKVVDTVRATSGGALARGPVVALVNEYSASAAELVAGALQDQRRATVVGARTFGKGSVQSILELPGGAGMRLTTMRYYTPSGRSIQAQGIAPDLTVAAGVAAEPGFGVVRESDLDNHLPAEGPPGSAQPDAGAPAPGDGGAAAPSTRLGVARELPDDPTGGPDQALSVGYQLLAGVLIGKP
ncbi:MAG: S41 family peptidase [Sorangiineae bacterium]|nr:S41 family peptidase [Polyangiaceae bacterium]MEB2321514.1 S41 family peptidase [Sorangiineae bacterium]